jgi:hypothetical protein
MPLIFTNPALLMGALAGAIPVIIHFLSRRKVQRRKFSDLRFLDEVQARQARSLGIRRWLLLLLRVLAIVLIALAAAGPRWGGIIAGGSGERSVLFVVDSSASMGSQIAGSADETGSTRLDEAVAACRAMIGSLPEKTTVQIITAGSRTEPLFGDWLPAGAGALQGTALIRPTDGAFDPAAVLREAASQVVRAPAAQVEMVWITDLQESLDRDENTQAAMNLVETGTVRHLVRQVGSATGGGGILSVNLPRRAVHQGENVTLTAQVTAQFDEEVFVLEMDGRSLAEAVVARATNEPTTISFALAAPAPGLHKGTVRKESDVFAADDSRPFVLQVPEALGVLIVHGRDRAVDAAAGRGGWRYLAQALAPGGNQGLFRVEAVESSALATGELNRHQVVIFVDPDPLGRRSLEGLQTWLRTGGAAVFLVGEPVQAGYLGGTLLPALDLSGNVVFVGGSPEDQHQQLPRIIDPAHPVFAGLETEALATMQDIVWRRWFRLEAGTGRVLLELTDESPLMIETDLGDGRVVVLPFNLDTGASGLVASPMALPFFQRLVSWLAGSAGPGPAINTEVGSIARVVPSLADSGNLLERTEALQVVSDQASGARSAGLVWQGAMPFLVGEVIDRAGFTAFMAAGDTVGLVAAAVPAAESNLDLWTVDQWRGLIQGWGLDLTAELSADDQDNLAGVMTGRELAPWFFFLALCLLLVELFVGRAAGGQKAISS